MKSNINIAILFLILPFILCSSTCNKKVLTPEYKGIKNVKLRTLNMSNAAVQFDLEYFNPNNFVIDIKETQLNVYINDQFVALAEQPTITQIPKSNVFLFPVIAHFDPIKVLGLAFKNIFSKSIKLTLQGNARLGRGGVYMKVPIDISEQVTLD